MNSTGSGCIRFVKTVAAKSALAVSLLPSQAAGRAKGAVRRIILRRPVLFMYICALALSAAVIVFAPVLRDWMLAAGSTSLGVVGNDPSRSREVDKLRSRIRNLQQQLDVNTPRKSYLIVDTSNNRFKLMSARKMIREGTCSTGSYVKLTAGEDRQWIFKTPRGRFYVQLKEKAPVWYKPDWAFVEEGQPVPPPFSPERYEAGVLGDYALHIGNGYLIHGTLYKRLLGMPVTHGCVRMDDDDLRSVYQNLTVGSAVYIY